MKLKSSKLIQSCTVCGKTGHNKRRCAGLSFENPRPVEAVETPEQSLRNSHISVTTASTPSSLHVVDLRDHERERQLEAIIPYREPELAASFRAVADFATAIRRAPSFVPVKKDMPTDPINSLEKKMPAFLKKDWTHAFQSSLRAVVARIRSLLHVHRFAPQIVGIAALLIIPFPAVASYQTWK
ncbi:MAG: hypothetical protein AAB932_03805, partial [Patescibacteria group bacterium]